LSRGEPRGPLADKLLTVRCLGFLAPTPSRDASEALPGLREALGAVAEQIAQLEPVEAAWRTQPPSSGYRQA
jgi:hypothetical protein